MIRFLIASVLLFSIISCKDFETEEYMKIENEAIGDIVLEMTDFEEMTKLRESKTKRLTLFISNVLDTTTAHNAKPESYFTGRNGDSFSRETIEENKREFEEGLEKFKREEALFKNFKSGRINKRILKNNFDIKDLDIEFVDIEKLVNLNLKKNEFGFLLISRIDFNRTFTKGYLHYTFFCGDACAWSNNIEIQKIDGKWTITEYFSGGIA